MKDQLFLDFMFLVVWGEVELLLNAEVRFFNLNVIYCFKLKPQK